MLTPKQAKAAEQRRIRAQLIAEEAARRAEEQAEEQAPRQQRVVVLRADGSVLREALVVRDAQRGGYRRADALRRMHAQHSGMVTALHLRAAELFCRDYEVGCLGANPGGVNMDRVDCSVVLEVPQATLDALARYRAACDAMGPSLRTPVQWVALGGWKMWQVARVLSITTAAASGYLVAGLDALADFYWPDRTPRAAAVPPDVVDAGVVDIPQERLGRGRRCA